MPAAFSPLLSQTPLSRFLERRLSRLAAPEAPASPADLVDRLFSLAGPPAFVALGRVVGAVRNLGEIRVRPLNPEADGESLAKCQAVWLRRPSGMWARVPVQRVARHGSDWSLALEGIGSRTLAEQFLHAEVGLDRSELPELDEGSHYWIDLLGCAVVNRQGLALGVVDRLETNGVQDWLVVGEHWIPFVDAHVDEVDEAQRRIVVDWDPTWLQGGED